MSEFDEDISSQEFEEPVDVDYIESSESEELQSDDSFDSGEVVDEGGTEEFQETAIPDSNEFQNYEENESFEDSSEPAENIDSESNDDISEYQDESQLSPSELREKGEQEAADAQREAEEWADNGGANRWSDGSIREGHEDDSYDRSTNELQQMEEEGLRQQQEYQEAKLTQETADAAAALDTNIEAKDDEVSDLDSQYDSARQNAEMAESDEDKDYWSNQSKDLESARDTAAYEASQLRSQRK